jgi:hypothetical protein
MDNTLDRRTQEPDAINILLVTQDTQITPEDALQGEITDALDKTPAAKGETQKNSVSLAQVDPHTGDILSTKPLGVVETPAVIDTKKATMDMSVDFGGDVMKAFTSASDPYHWLPTGWKEYELIAQNTLAYLSDAEILELLDKQPQRTYSLQPAPFQLSYQQETTTELQPETSTNPFFDPKENLFAHTKAFLNEFIADEALRDKLDAIPYEDVRAALPLTLSQKVGKDTASYERITKGMVLELMEAMLTSAGESLNEEMTVDALKQRCKLEAHTPYLADADSGESVTLNTSSFDEAFPQLVRNIGFDERKRQQTFTQTSRKTLQDAYDVGAAVIGQEVILRVMRPASLNQETVVLAYPAFDEAALTRQADNLGKNFSTTEMIETLPNTLWNTAKQSLSRTPATALEDTDRLLSVYTMAMSKKLLTMESDDPNRESTEQFAQVLLNARQRTNKLLGEIDAPSEETQKVLSNGSHFLDFVLEGAPPAMYFDGGDFTDMVKKLKDIPKSELAKQFTEKSAFIADLPKDGLYPQTYQEAQTTLTELARSLQIGLSEVDGKTGKMEFTDRYFLLGTDVPNEQMDAMKNADKFPAERIAQILGYNMIGVLAAYKKHGGDMKEVTFGEIKTRDEQKLSSRMEMLKTYAALLTKDRIIPEHQKGGETVPAQVIAGRTDIELPKLWDQARHWATAIAEAQGINATNRRFALEDPEIKQFAEKQIKRENRDALTDFFTQAIKMANIELPKAQFGRAA